MILPAAHNGVGEHRRAGGAALDGQLDRGRDQYLGRFGSAVAAFAKEFLVTQRDDDGRRGSALEHLTAVFADQLEILDALDQNLGRKNFDVHARQVLRKGLSDRLFALVRGHRLQRLAGRQRSQSLATERQVEDGERELRVVLRQSLCLLPEQPTLEPLDLLLQQPRELLVFVALVLDLCAACFESLQSLFESRLGHDDHECKISRSLSSCSWSSSFFSLLVL